MLIGKLSGNKLGAAGPPFKKNSPSRSVNENWLKLRAILNQCLDKFRSTKMTSPREKLPWLSKSIPNLEYQYTLKGETLENVS